MSVEVTAPETYTGAITGSLCSKRGRVQGMDTKAGATILQGFVPLAEMFGYASELRSATSGRGNFTMHFEHYQAVPFSIAEEIVEKLKEDKKKK